MEPSFRSEPAAMSQPVPALRIDFVSDVSCPWCAIGLASLRQAIARVGDAVDVELHFQPFELNPQMAAVGEDVGEHLQRKYGSTPEQLTRNREAIRVRGAELGFTFNARDRIYNTFDAHRLLHWAGTLGADAQLALKQALLGAYFTDGRDVSNTDVLVAVASDAGLDERQAQAVLASNAYADDVRAQERYFIERGINGVPAVIFNERHLISGGQPVEVFEEALRKIAGVAQAA
jgi:predicted DsbA family dithiol-disulfide isomerase